MAKKWEKDKENGMSDDEKSWVINTNDAGQN